MKKLRLKALSLGAREILNREQLKSIYGGFSGSGSEGGSDPGWGCNSGTIHVHCWCFVGVIGENLTEWDCCIDENDNHIQPTNYQCKLPVYGLPCAFGGYWQCSDW